MSEFGKLWTRRLRNNPPSINTKDDYIKPFSHTSYELWLQRNKEDERENWKLEIAKEFIEFLQRK